MKIALFTDTFTPQINGVAKTYQRLIDYLNDKNIETKVFAPAGKTSDSYDTDHGKVVRFFSCDFALYPDCQISLPNYFSVHDTLDRFQPDLIHLATPFFLGLTGLKYAQNHMVPKVAVFHTNFPQYLEYYRMPWLKKLSWRFMRWFHRQADKNYCPSHDTIRLLSRHGIDNLELWTRGVDHRVFNPAWRDLELRRHLNLDGKVVLLYVGRLAPEKNVDILLRAMAVANENIANLHLLVVGDGPSREELEAVASDNVTFMGYRSGEELSKIYASSDIFVCPSVTETFGNVILEAMSSALPVIAPLAGGIKENLFPFKTGLACAPVNYLSMASAIVKLGNDYSLRQNLAGQALEHARSQSWNEIFYRLVNSYEDVIDTHKRNSHNSSVYQRTPAG